MNSFADAVLSVLFGWLQALINWVWNVIDQGGSTLGTWFLNNWIPLTLILIAGGLVVDWLIWFIRWRPYHVWATRFRRIGRFFRRSSPDMDTGNIAYATGYPEGAEDEAPEEDDRQYIDTYNTELYSPAELTDPSPDLHSETYVPEAMMPDNTTFDDGDEMLDMQDGRWPELPQEDTPFSRDNDALPDASWEDAQDDGYDQLPGEGDNPYPFEEPIAYTELLLLAEEDDDTETEASWQDGDAVLAEATEMEAEEMFDDFSNHGAPEPPQKRRRWEFPEEDAPATTRRSSADDFEPPSPRQNSRPPAAARRRQETEDASGSMSMDAIDPLAPYDAPEVIEQMQQARPRRQSRADVVPAGEDLPPSDESSQPRRRRSRRYRSETGREQYEQSAPDVHAADNSAWPEDGPAEESDYEDAPPVEDMPSSRRERRTRRSRSRAQNQPQEEYADDFADDGSFDSDDAYRQPAESYEDDAYFHDEPYAQEDLPDAPEWPNWEEEPELPPTRGRQGGGVTKPSLFDRLRGLKSPTREPLPDEDLSYDDGGGYNDYGDVDQEPAPKKKGRLSNWLNSEQAEFEQPKPKPRVRQEDAYREPVYPPKKRPR